MPTKGLVRRESLVAHTALVRKFQTWRLRELILRPLFRRQGWGSFGWSGVGGGGTAGEHDETESHVLFFCGSCYCWWQWWGLVGTGSF